MRIFTHITMMLILVGSSSIAVAKPVLPLTEQTEAPEVQYAVFYWLGQIGVRFHNEERQGSYKRGASVLEMTTAVFSKEEIEAWTDLTLLRDVLQVNTYLGHCYYELKELEKAGKAYQYVLDLSRRKGITVPVRGMLNSRLEKIEAYSNTRLKITTTPNGVKVTANDKELGFTPLKTVVAPGKYILQGELKGYQNSTREIEVILGSTTLIDDWKLKRVQVVKKQDPPLIEKSSNTIPIIGWSTLALGALSVGLGGYFQISYDELRTDAMGCRSNRCSEKTYNDKIDEANEAQNLALGLLIGGSAVVGVGISLLLYGYDVFAKKGQDEVLVSPSFGQNSVGISVEIPF